jgi:regulator of nucleoside diphosphate kinase
MMRTKPIQITEFDLKRLAELIREAGHSDYRDSEYLKDLEKELERAEVVPAKEISGDVITMNSRVRLVDIDSGEEMTYTLVFPEDADIAENKISVLAPIGTAMLGYRIDDSFSWTVPDGERRLQVKEILYQPESSGDYHL